MFTWLILCCHLVWWCGDKVTMEVLCRQKETYKWKRLGHQMMHGMAIWKPVISKIAKASRGNAPGRGAYSAPIWTPSCNGQCADTFWVIKLNPSWKTDVNKCLNKALPMNQTERLAQAWSRQYYWYFHKYKQKWF